jgi:hypothetical protein
MDNVRQIAKGRFCLYFISICAFVQRKITREFLKNVCSYVNNKLSIRILVSENNGLDPNSFFPDNRYNHIQQVQERLNFLRFLLKVCVMKY